MTGSGRGRGAVSALGGFAGRNARRRSGGRPESSGLTGQATSGKLARSVPDGPGRSLNFLFPFLGGELEFNDPDFGDSFTFNMGFKF